MLHRVEAALEALGAPGRRVLVAASGGLDSTVLVHVVAALRERLGIDLAIGHVNHGLRGAESDADEKAVAALAGRLDVRFAAERIDPGRLREGGSSRLRPTTQEAARTLRRGALERIRAQLGCDRIATAHHADDQAETVLMRILRGCAPGSLGGIGETSPDGITIRPLLGISREEIAAHAREYGLDWREDASNREAKYTRNRVRAQLIPELRAFNPQLLRAIGDLAEAQRRDAEWVDSLVEEEAAVLFEASHPEGLDISGDGWAERPEALSRRLVVRGIVEMGGGRDVSRTHVLRALEFLRGGRAGTAIELPGGLELRRLPTGAFRLTAASES